MRLSNKRLNKDYVRSNRHRVSGFFASKKKLVTCNLQPVMVYMFWCLFSSLFFLSFAVYAEEITRIVAKVNKQVITSRDLDDYCKALSFRSPDERGRVSCKDEEFRRLALERLIEDKLVLDEAKKEKIYIPRSWIDNRLNQTVASYPSREDFEKALIEKGLSVTLLKKRIKEQYYMREIIERYVRSFISVSPQEISRYYDNNKVEFYTLPKYVFYIAKSRGEDDLIKMSRLIEEEGIAQAHRAYRGDLIKFESTKEEFKEEITRILKELKSGEHKIAKVDDIFYLIYLEELVTPYMLALDEVKEKIYSYLWQEKFKKRFSEWVKELKEKAVIKNYYD